MIMDVPRQVPNTVLQTPTAKGEECRLLRCHRRENLKYYIATEEIYYSSQ
jgi:hypothetical protein